MLFNPLVSYNNKGWGPSPEMTADLNLVYSTSSNGIHSNIFSLFEPALKPENLGKVCDFTFATYQRNQREQRYGWNVPAAFEDELQFQAIDVRPSNKVRSLWGKRKNLNKESMEAYNQKQQELNQRVGRKNRSEQKKQQAVQKARQIRLSARHMMFTELSIEPSISWITVAEIPFNLLAKQLLEDQTVTVQDLCWKGQLCYYNKQMDRITPQYSFPLQNFNKNTNFYLTTTSEDVTIQKYLMDEDRDIQVAATAQVLSCLMSAPQSKYSWHLKATKLEGKIIIDKEDDSIVDMVTVNETAAEPPTQNAENKLNRPAALGEEAFRIHQNFSQQVLELDKPLAQDFEEPSFISKLDNPAKMAYRYRVFTLPGKAGHPSEFGRKTLKVITRAEVHAKLKTNPSNITSTADGDEGNYVFTSLVNEFDQKTQKNWRTSIENQKGALFTTEISKNLTRLQKSVSSAIIGGCGVLKMGFIGRKIPTDAESHLILSVQSYPTKDLSVQIGPKMSNAWGIVRSVVDMLMQQEDGHYILLKDPLKPILFLYKLPEDNEEEKNDETKVDNFS